MPTTIPASVRGASSAACAMPKSVTLTTPSLRSSRLLGFTSRWTTPAWWAESSASADCASTLRVCAALSRPSRASSTDSGSPSTSSMTR